MAKKSSKKKSSKKTTTKKSIRTPEADAKAKSLLGQAGQPKDNVQWRTRSEMAALLCPDLLEKDKALVAEKRSASEERKAEIKAEQKSIKQQMAEIIYGEYPDLKKMIDACPTKQRDGSGSGSGRPGRRRASTDFVALAAKRVKLAKQAVNEALGDVGSELESAQAELDRALSNEERRAKKLERITSGIAKAEENIDALETRLADAKAKLESLQEEQAEIESGADVKVLEEAVAKAQAKADRKASTKAVQSAQAKVAQAEKEMVKIAQAVAAGKSVALDENDEFVIG